MTKCISVQTPDFEKRMKKLGDKQKVKKIMEKIKKLTEAENDPSLLPKLSNGTQVQSAAHYYGKYIICVNNVFSLDIDGGALRALAVVKEENGVKMFVWFFGGSHEDYNKEIRADKLKEKESHLMESKNNRSLIEDKINELRENNIAHTKKPTYV